MSLVCCSIYFLEHKNKLKTRLFHFGGNSASCAHYANEICTDLTSSRMSFFSVIWRARSFLLFLVFFCIQYGGSRVPIFWCIALFMQTWTLLPKAKGIIIRMSTRHHLDTRNSLFLSLSLSANLTFNFAWRRACYWRLAEISCNNSTPFVRCQL